MPLKPIAILWGLRIPKKLGPEQFVKILGIVWAKTRSMALTVHLVPIERFVISLNLANLSTPISVDKEVSVAITSLSHGGSGVGRFENFVIFCPFTCPGDEV